MDQYILAEVINPTNGATTRTGAPDTAYDDSDLITSNSEEEVESILSNNTAAPAGIPGYPGGLPEGWDEARVEEAKAAGIWYPGKPPVEVGTTVKATGRVSTPAPLPS